MSALVTAVVALLTSLLPTITAAAGASSVVDNIVTTLINLIPLLANVGTELIAEVQNIIAVVKGSGAVTPAQMAALQAAEVQLDASFEAAATAAGDPETN